MFECLVVLLLLGGYYAGYCAGRNDGRREAQRQARPRTGSPIPMDHTHGGDDDD